MWFPPREGRKVDIPVKLAHAGRPVNRGNSVPLRLQTIDQSFNIGPAIKRQAGALECIAIRAKIELGSMHRDTAWHERVQRILNEVEPVSKRAEMLEAAGRPTKVEI